MKNDDNFSHGKKNKFSYLTKEELLMYYIDFALREIEKFLHQIEYKHAEPNDFLFTYHRAFEFAYEKYDENRVDFKYFLLAILRRELMHDIADECHKNKALFSAISLDSKVVSEEHITLLDIIPDPTSIDPRYAFEWVDRKKLRLSDSGKNQNVFHINPRRTEFVERVVRYRAAGFTLDEIAKRTGSTIGKVRYVLAIIKEKRRRKIY